MDKFIKDISSISSKQIKVAAYVNEARVNNIIKLIENVKQKNIKVKIYASSRKQNKEALIITWEPCFMRNTNETPK